MYALQLKYILGSYLIITVKRAIYCADTNQATVSRERPQPMPYMRCIKHRFNSKWEYHLPRCFKKPF